MIKKYSKLFSLVVMSFFISMIPVFAKEMTLEELGTAIGKETNDDAIYAFIIGDYVFTSELDGSLTTKDIMLASRSIKVKDVNGKTKADPIYNEMTIFYIEFDGENWNYIKNIDGTTQFNNQKIDIKYIDYNYQTEDSKAKISYDVETEGYEKYKEVLQRALKFEPEEAYDGSKIQLNDEGKLTGLLLRNDKVTLNDNDKKKYGNPMYYFAYILEVPGATEATTITSKRGSNGTLDPIAYADFDVTKEDGEDKTPGIVVLVPLSDEDVAREASEKFITITVDVDGDAKEYAPSTYTIDYSGLEFNEQTKIDVSFDVDADEYETYKNILQTKLGFNTSEAYDANKITNDGNGNLTGTLLKNTNVTLSESDKEKYETPTYYFAYILEVPGATEQTTITTQRADENEAKIVGFDKFDVKDGEKPGIVMLVPIKPKDAKKETNNENKKITITVDLDGEGKKYLATKYTIDYSALDYKEMTQTDATVSESIQDEKSGYNATQQALSLEQDGDVVTVSGVIIETKKDEATDGEYLFALTLNPTITDNTEITIKDVNTGREETYKKSDTENWDENVIIDVKIAPLSATPVKPLITLLLRADKEVSTQQYQITVDSDGADNDVYLPSTITVDYTDVILAPDYVSTAATNTKNAKSLKFKTQNLEVEYNKDQNRKFIVFDGKQYYLESIDGYNYIEQRDQWTGNIHDKFVRDINSSDSETPYGEWKYTWRGFEKFDIENILLIDSQSDIISIEKSTDEVDTYNVTISDEAINDYLSQYIYKLEGTDFSKSKKLKVKFKDGYVVSIKGTIYGQDKTYNIDTEITDIGQTIIEPLNYNFDKSKEDKVAMRKAWSDEQKKHEDENNNKGINPNASVSENLQDVRTGYNGTQQSLSLEQNDDLVTVSGILTESKKDETTAGEYLFALTLNPTITPNTEITIEDVNTGEDVTYTPSDSKNWEENVIIDVKIAPLSVEPVKPTITLLLRANQEAITKQYNITIDSDGSQNDEYFPSTLTVDYTNVVTANSFISDAATKTLKADSLKFETENYVVEYNKSQNMMVTILDGNKQYYYESIDGAEYQESNNEQIPYNYDVFFRTITKNQENEEPVYGNWEYTWRGYRSFTTTVENLLLIDEESDIEHIEKVVDEDYTYNVTISDDAINKYLSTFMYKSTATRVSESKNLKVKVDADGYVTSIEGTLYGKEKNSTDYKSYNVNTKITDIESTNIEPSKYGMDKFTTEQKQDMRQTWLDERKKHQEENNSKNNG